MSKRSASDPGLSMSARSLSGFTTSWVRVGIASAVAVLGIAWIAVYMLAARGHAVGDLNAKGTAVVHTSLPWMSDLKNWNYMIGFGLIMIALIIAANRTTPLGRGRGVVVGMLACFLFGLAWVVTYYMAASHISSIPIMKDLNQYNLLVGVAFMAVGFSFATKWE
ncbi:MAG: cell division protein CrgA [Marmoricola sp.]